MPDISLDSFFARKILVMFVNVEPEEYTRMTYLGRDAGGILLKYEETGNVAYYPWHRIEEIMADSDG